ncbi:Ger(x)C family spore germination protein [Lentibacillus sediminis]|uniref:Ger(x)C family spore germination protein n=1 Tax=Lentibacillus sediminis TaxID=1940529 RepID=UPI000C1C2FD9|nr:Ger(x)C family spore germination protein [Lentibacillus sediminis]
MKKRIGLFVCCVMSFLLAGCWDEIDIEDRGFVIGAAVDLAEDQPTDHYTLDLTNQFVILRSFASSGGSSSGGGGSQKPYANVTATGESILEITREMAALAGRAPYHEHLKILVVAAEVAREPGLFASIMDLYVRDQEMRREIRVLISEGEAKKIMEIEPSGATLPARYIYSLMENNNKTIELLEPVRMGSIHEYLLEKNSYVLPHVQAEGSKLNSKGAAVIQGHNNKMVGALTGTETKGLNLITGKNSMGTIKFEIDGQLMIYELENMSSEIKVDPSDRDNIEITVNIETEGRISEMFGSRTLMDESYLREIEQHINKSLEELANQALTKGQEELQVDFFGFGEKIKQKHYGIWTEIKDNWDYGSNIFSNQTTVDITANSIVRTIGAADKVKD